jgi:hypothetical protein
MTVWAVLGHDVASRGAGGGAQHRVRCARNGCHATS